MPYTPVYSDDEKVEIYKTRIEHAEQSHGRWRKDAEIYLTYYRLKNRVFTKGGQKVIVPAATKNVDAMFAVLTAFEVVPVVSAKGNVPGDIALVQDAALKNEWEEAGVVEEVEDAIKESLITKIGYVKVDYRYEDEEREVDASTPQMDPDTGETVTPTETETEVIEDRIVVEHVPWDEVYFDPEAKKWKDIRWVAQKHVIPLKELQEDERYDTEGIDAGDTTLEWENRPSGDVTPDEERVTVYEVFDLEAGTRCWLAKAHDKIIREAPNAFAMRLDIHKRNPFVAFITRSNPGEVPGISDVEAMKTAIDEANVLRSNHATFVDRMKPKMLSEEGAFTDQGKKAFKSQEWGEVVELRQGIPMNAVQPMQYPQLPSEFWAQDNKALQDADDVIGSNSLVQGLLPSGRKTATAMQHMASASTVRQAEKRNRLERFYRDIADRMLYLMKLFYEQERIVKMVEDYGDVVWEYDRDDINFDTTISINIEPKEIKDTETMREMGMTLLNLLGSDPNIDQAELKKLVLIKYFRFPPEDVRLLIKTQEDMQAEQLASEQVMAGQAQAQQGVMPDPSGVPGPVPGDALAQMVNAEGEM